MNPTGGDLRAASGGRRKDPPGTEGLTKAMIDMIYSLPNQPTRSITVPIPRIIPECIRKMACESYGYEYRRPTLADLAVVMGVLVRGGHAPYTGTNWQFRP